MSIAEIQKMPGVQAILDKCHADIEALTGHPVTLNFSLKFHYLSTRVLAGIITDVCEVDWDDVVGTSRKGVLVISRHLYCYFAREYQKKKFVQISQLLNRDHTTVMHSVNIVKNMIEVSDELYMTYFSEIENRINKYLQS